VRAVSALCPLFTHAQCRSCRFPEIAAGDRRSLFIVIDTGIEKDAIWQNFGEMEAVAEGSQSKTMYVPSFACNSRVIASAGQLRDHWAGCKERRRGVGQLDSGYISSRRRKMAKTSKLTLPAETSKATSRTSAVDTTMVPHRQHVQERAGALRLPDAGRASSSAGSFRPCSPPNGGAVLNV
jgi:hypothetical protein